MNVKKIYTAAVLALQMACVLAGDLEDGKEAFKNDNYSVAIQKYKLAAANGNAEAQYELGWIFHSGTGVTQNRAEAVRWYKLAASQGNGDALYILSVMYKTGVEDVIQIDSNESLRLVKMAAAKGNRFAQKELAIRYSDGSGVVQDFIRVHMWSNVAASRGDKFAAELRGQIESKMTRPQIAEAQKMAHDCEIRSYMNCD
jgi:uncharacterized protein